MKGDVQKIKYLRDKFKNNLSILQKKKDSFFKLFRSKLEEKKIEQIKDSLFVRDNSNT